MRVTPCVSAPQCFIVEDSARAGTLDYRCVARVAEDYREGLSFLRNQVVGDVDCD